MITQNQSCKGISTKRQLQNGQYDLYLVTIVVMYSTGSSGPSHIFCQLCGVCCFIRLSASLETFSSSKAVPLMTFVSADSDLCTV